MKGIFAVFLFGFTLLSNSCQKETTTSDNLAGAAFINAAPGVDTSGADMSLDIFIDTVRKTYIAIPYMSSSGYLLSAPGTRNVQVRSSLDSNTSFFEATTETFEINKGTTYLIYDTLSATDSTLNAIRLSDDLTPPAAGFVHFRFINAAVNSTPLDVVFVRSNPNDSVTILNRAYIGNTPNASLLSPFSGKLPLGVYTIKLKEAGTQTVLAEAPITLSPYTSIYTFYATGTAAGFPLSIGGFKHYP